MAEANVGCGIRPKCYAHGLIEPLESAMTNRPTEQAGNVPPVLTFLDSGKDVVQIT